MLNNQYEDEPTLDEVFQDIPVARTLDARVTLKPTKPDPTFVLDCPRAVAGIASVMEWATKKDNPYPRMGYKRYKPDVYKAALMRHLLAMYDADASDDPSLNVDSESGLPHVLHMACNALILAELILRQGK